MTRRTVRHPAGGVELEAGSPGPVTGGSVGEPSTAMAAGLCRAVGAAVLLAVTLTGCWSDEQAHLDPADVAGAPTEQADVTAVSGFISNCGFSHHSYADPIRAPFGRGAHLHAFFGQHRDGTTCRHRGETGTYWLPALLAGGEMVKPVAARIYYRAAPGVPAAAVVAYPAGLAMIAGELHARPADHIAGWACASQLDRRSPHPPDCPSGEGHHLLVTFPDCWDGQRLTSPGHRAHLHYSRSGQCPPTHPVHVPQLLLDVRYPHLSEEEELTFSSGNLDEVHADFINTWDQQVLEDKVQRCIARAVLCPEF
jgi:hypothetical protein